MFYLARLTVRQAGYRYSKGHSRSQYTIKLIDVNEGHLPENNENNDSIDIETFKDDEEKEFDSSDTSNAGKSDLTNKTDPNDNQHFAGLKDQNAKFLNQLMNANGGLNSRNSSLFKEETSSSGRSSNPNYEEERKRRSDHLDMISKQIELCNVQTEQLRVQLESNELIESEVLPRLLKLEDEQKRLIEEKTNLVKQIQNLDR